MNNTTHNEETYTKEVDYRILEAIYKNHTHIYGEECKVKGCDIFSVQRLSDMEIFKVGDKVSSTWGPQVIKGFIIVTDNTITVKFSTCRNPLSKINKQKINV